MTTPLRLVPWERHMLSDDHRSYPMNFFARFRFRGHFRRDALDAAAQATIERHPLTTAVAHRTWYGRWEWRGVEPQLEVRRFARTERERLPPAEPLDIRRRPGLRLWILEDAEGTDIVTQLHHSMSDALGGFQLIEDFLVGYALNVGASCRRSSLRPVDAGRLARRGTFGVTKRNFFSALWSQRRGLGALARFYGRTPKPLVERGNRPLHPPLADNWPTFITHRFTPEETQTYRDRATRSGVTVHELLLRDLFLTIGRSRAEGGTAAPGDLLRVFTPINMRLPFDRKTPAANLVSHVFYDVKQRDLADPETLLASLSEAGLRNRRDRAGLSWLWGLQAVAWTQIGFAIDPWIRRCTTTALLTNVGGPLDRIPLPRRDGQIVVGDATLEEIDLVAPLRAMTQASIAVHVYADRLGLTLNYDSAALTPADAGRLMDSYVNRIRESATASTVQYGPEQNATKQNVPVQTVPAATVAPSSGKPVASLPETTSV